MAISRAKHKLILVGSSSTVKKYHPYEKLLGLLRQDQLLHLEKSDKIQYKEIIPVDNNF